jgi:D-alanyl-lipoteichoic acid acyltransferase DltB (MBOAT superfamily)
MTFNSLAFAVFLPIVLSVYYTLTRKAQNYWLLAASCVFYGWWDPRFLLLLAFSTVVDFLCAREIARHEDARVRKRYLLVSLTSNLVILGFFKYYNFFLHSTEQALDTIGWHVPLPALQIVLPVGISFYTFQAISYTIDVYRRTIPPCRDFAAFALSVCYFPHLVAGPIQRASYLLPQLEAERRVQWIRIREGGALILYGLFKKVAVADAIAPLVDMRFTNAAAYGWSDLLFALYLFAIQIYCDFSGYTDIARGTSKLFGIELMLNFDHPYFSTSITEFWRRWHISLSTWLREYLYIPLGGNRHGVRKTYRNLMMTMLLGGLWHGANWTFVIWGALHGAYLAIHKMLLDRASRRRAGEPALAAVGAGVVPAASPTAYASFASMQPEGDPVASARSTWFGPRAIALAKGVATFHLVCLAWIFFRADSFRAGMNYLAGIVTLRAQSPSLATLQWFGFRTTILIAMLFAIDYVQWRSGRQTVFLDWHWSMRGAVYAAIIVVMLVCGGLDVDVPFIYFQF